MSFKNKLPDRWLNYSKMGTVIEGTRLLPIKVPLKDSFTKNLPEENWFTPDILLQLLKSKNISAGLVIDLTFTEKYYFPEDFTKNQICYSKIFMPGRSIPKRSIIKQFFNVVEQFERANAGNKKIILVHCTHGLNRTGYMVCKYLIECKQMTADQAIDAFNLARGHSIERNVYLNDLRFNETNNGQESGSHCNTVNQRINNPTNNASSFSSWTSRPPQSYCYSYGYSRSCNNYSIYEPNNFSYGQFFKDQISHYTNPQNYCGHNAQYRHLSCTDLSNNTQKSTAYSYNNSHLIPPQPQYIDRYRNHTRYHPFISGNPGIGRNHVKSYRGSKK